VTALGIRVEIGLHSVLSFGNCDVLKGDSVTMKKIVHRDRLTVSLKKALAMNALPADCLQLRQWQITKWNGSEARSYVTVPHRHFPR